MATVFNKYLWQQTDREEKHYNQQRANVSVHFHAAVDALFSFRIDGFPLHFSCSSILHLIYFLPCTFKHFFFYSHWLCMYECMCVSVCVFSLSLVGAWRCDRVCVTVQILMSCLFAGIAYVWRDATSHWGKYKKNSTSEIWTETTYRALRKKSVQRDRAPCH